MTDAMGTDSLGATTDRGSGASVTWRVITATAVNRPPCERRSVSSTPN